MASAIGNIRKMATQYTDPIYYTLPLYDNLEPKYNIPLNPLIGKKIKLTFMNQINCVVTGNPISKTYGEGMSYAAFISSPLAAESIFHPELSKAHLGIGLRDLEWEQKHDLQPHYVYIALTSLAKVGVTRLSNVPFRWIDQGAWKVIILAETPYRKIAGDIEIFLKKHYSDTTPWRKMLTNTMADIDLIKEKEVAASLLTDDLKPYISESNLINEFFYPVISYPSKVKSVNLRNRDVIEARLIGIRGQYLLFDDDTVLNVRSHTGLKILLEY